MINELYIKIFQFIPDSDLIKLEVLSKQHQSLIIDIFNKRAPKKSEEIKKTLTDILKKYPIPQPIQTGLFKGRTITVIKNDETANLYGLLNLNTMLEDCNTVNKQLKYYTNFNNHLLKNKINKDDLKVHTKGLKTLMDDFSKIKENSEEKRNVENTAYKLSNLNFCKKN